MDVVIFGRVCVRPTVDLESTSNSYLEILAGILPVYQTVIELEVRGVCLCWNGWRLYSKGWHCDYDLICSSYGL